MAVLVNDFGSINTDAELVVGVESDDSLANGCVCCTVRDDLIESVARDIALCLICSNLARQIVPLSSSCFACRTNDQGNRG